MVRAAEDQALTWDFARPDWQERLAQRQSLLPDLPLDVGEAGRAVGIYNRLRLPDVPGQPSMGEAGGEWGRDIVRAVFGSLVDGSRMVREVFAAVPKKNAKTTNAAAIAVTALLMNERPRAELILTGPTQEIADTGFSQAQGMIDADPYLRQRFHVQDHIKTIIDRTNKAKLKIKTFDMKVATGSKPVTIIVDEIHLMGSMSFAARVLGQLRGGMIANPEAFLLMITTQSDEPPAGVFKQELDYARGVRDGRIKGGNLLPLIYELPEDVQTDPAMGWRDPALWPMVLPNLGHSISIERLKQDHNQAIEKGPEEERRWASQHLNVQIGLALHSDRWRGADYWEGAADEQLQSLEALLSRSEVAVVGIDGGGLDDLFGLCVVGREKETKRWLYWVRAFAHRGVLERRKDIAPRLLDFEKEGDLAIVESAEQDLLGVVEICTQVRASGLMPEKAGIGVDPASLGMLLTVLEQAGFTITQKGSSETRDVVGVSQGVNLFGAMTTLERKLHDRTALHGGQPLFAWCVGNAKAEQKGNAVMVTKQTAGKAKIDPLIAAFVATKVMEGNPTAAGHSVYATRGLLRV